MSRGHQRIAEAIAARLPEDEGPDIVIVNPDTVAGWLEEEAIGSARTILARELSHLAGEDQFRFYYPVAAGGAPIYVHVMIMIVDDTLLRVGSLNLNNRSMGFDTEADIAFEATRPELRQAAYLHLTRSPEELLLMAQIKGALDPKSILSPGRVLP